MIPSFLSARRAVASVLALGSALVSLSACAAPVKEAVVAPVCTYRVVKTFPHDPTAFTEGLFYQDGALFESTGQPGDSWITKRSLDSSTPTQQTRIDPTYFGEGIVAWGDQIISLTWRDGVGYRWDKRTFQPLGFFHYAGEGWGMTIHDGVVYQSDGSASLRLRDPKTMEQTGSLQVTDQGRPIRNLNELEWIDGEIWANVWMTDRIARIDPATGHVKEWMDMSGLRAKAGTDDPDAVLNGIAYDAAGKRIFVTGKYWSTLFQIEPECR
ncbi:glutaminyl-peptide cyclotransferase [Novosphingobium sp. 9]|uniref:glutaminyl-peptide cyclotransferase n=1 Tax=Novosphingobium sp. 9 TaxID=2025349 RepID=UPI0021B6095B|nr:glutaminyl-peptide cyclotransferase [Novosphingobium sp. 9]